MEAIRNNEAQEVANENEVRNEESTEKVVFEDADLTSQSLVEENSIKDDVMVLSEKGDELDDGVEVVEDVKVEEEVKLMMSRKLMMA